MKMFVKNEREKKRQGGLGWSNKAKQGATWAPRRILKCVDGGAPS